MLWGSGNPTPSGAPPPHFHTQSSHTIPNTGTALATPLKLVNRKCNSMHLMLATVAAAASPAEWKSASTPPATHLPGKYPLEIGRPCRCLLFYEFRLHPADVLHCRSCLSCLPNPCKQVKNVVKQTTVQKVGGHDGCVCGFYCRILFRGLTNGKGIQ